MTPEQIDELLGRMKPDGVNAVCCGVNCNEPLIRLVLVEVDKHADIALKPKTDPCEAAFQAWRAKYGSFGVDGQYLVDNGKAMMTEGEARLPFRAAWDAAKERTCGNSCGKCGGELAAPLGPGMSPKCANGCDVDHTPYKERAT